MPWRVRLWIIRKAPNRNSSAPAWIEGVFSFYGINQTLEGIQDRRAVGTEFRYFDDKKNAFGLLDYDTYFKAVNAAQFMGMTKGMSAAARIATLSFMLDHRKTPSLSIRNALNGATTSSVSDLLQTMSASSLRDLALARTAISNMGQVGITVPVREKWQVGGDFRLTNTTGLGASGQTDRSCYRLANQPKCTGTQTPQGCCSANAGSRTGKKRDGADYRQRTVQTGRYLVGQHHAQHQQLGERPFRLSSTTIPRSTTVWMMDTTLQLVQL